MDERECCSASALETPPTIPEAVVAMDKL